MSGSPAVLVLVTRAGTLWPWALLSVCWRRKGLEIQAKQQDVGGAGAESAVGCSSLWSVPPWTAAP